MKTFRIGGVRVGVSDKADGNMKVFDDAGEAEVVKNRKRFLSEMELDMKSSYFVKVAYETDDFCRFMRASEENGLWLDRKAERCDGLLTNNQGVGLFLPLADCVGMLLYDAKNESMMMVHCGRQTILQDGAFKAVRYIMREAGTEPGEVLAWLSPSAGRENYPLYDLGGISAQEAVVEQLMKAGVELGNIRESDIDTTVDERYFSHSQGDKQERFAIVGVIDGLNTKE